MRAKNFDKIDVFRKWMREKKKRKEKNDKIFWNALIKFNKIKRLEIFLRRAFTPIMHSLGYIFKSFI